MRPIEAFVAVTLLACAAPPAHAQAPPGQETTDVYIRRKAGLSAATVKGDIEIIDVGHHPLDTMLSIVANHGPSGWRVSYACAESPHCGENGEDHNALNYTLTPDRSAKLDALLDELRATPEVGGTAPRPELICGHLTISINYRGFQRDYIRACVWGPKLGELEDLLRPPQP